MGAAARPSRRGARALAALLLAAGCRAHRCLYGTTPGGWHAFEAGQVGGRGKHPDWNRLDDGPESVWLPLSAEDPAVPFGSNFHSYDPACPLRNLLRRYWAAAPPADAEVVNLASPTTIVLLGDSIDSHFVDYLCIEYSRRNLTGWKAWVHSHAWTNYCILPSGLRIVQVYMLRNSAADDLVRLDTVRKLFAGEDDVSRFDGWGGKRSTLAGRAEEVALFKGTQPQLVVFSSAYWPLQHFASGFPEEHTPDLLPADFVATFANETRGLLAAARAAFPSAQLALHTSGGIRTDCDFGTNVDRSNKRIWGRKSYVAQINAALRHVASAERARLVDLELMASALTPRQLTADDVHPRSFFSLEVLNVYLHMIAEAAQWEREHPAGLAAQTLEAVEAALAGRATTQL